MAREVIINAKVNTGNSAKDVQSVEKSMDGLSKSISKNTSVTKDFDAELKRITQEVKSGDLSFRELNKKIQEYQSIVLQAGKDSPIGQQALREASTLQDRLDDVRQSTRTLANDFRNTRAAIEGITVGVQVYQGVASAQALFGAESEQLLQTLTKLQAVQGVLNSLTAIQNALKKEGALANVLITKTQVAYTTAVGASTGALKLLRIALISTGIGAIVVAVGMLIANFEKITDLVRSAVDRFKNLGDGMKTFISIVFPVIGIIRGVASALESLGIIESDQEKERKKNFENEQRRSLERIKQTQRETDEKIEALKNENKELKRTDDLKIRLLKAEGASKEELFEAEQKLRKETISRSLEEGKLLVEKNKQLANEFRLKQALGELTKEEADNINQIIRDNNKIIQEGNEFRQKLRDDIKVEDAKFRTEQIKEERKTNEKKAEEDRKTNEKKAEEERKAFEAEQERRRKELELLTDLRLENLEDENQKRIAKLKEQQAREEQRIIEEFGEETELLKELRAKQKNELEDLENEINERIANENLERIQREQKAELELRKLLAEEDSEELMQAQKELWAFERDLLLENEDLTESERLKIIEEYNQKEQDLDKAHKDKLAKNEADLVDAKKQLAQDSFDTLIGLATSFQADSEKGQKRAFQIQKAAAIANALVNTYKSATAAYDSQLTIPSPDAPVRAKIAAGVAIASGLANVNNIRKQQFGGSGGGGGATSGASVGASFTSGIADPSEQIRLFGQANEGSQIVEGQEQQQQEQKITVTAEVVETDMTSTQKKISNIESFASL